MRAFYVYIVIDFGCNQFGMDMGECWLKQEGTNCYILRATIDLLQ